MDITSLITIAVVIAVAYLLIRFVVSPIFKAIFAVIFFIVILYLLQRYFSFDLSKILSPFGINLDMNKLDSSFNWILGPAGFYIDRAKNFLDFIWGNFPKSLNK